MIEKQQEIEELLEGESLFIAAADFFSLIALAAIVSVMVYGSAIRSTGSTLDPSADQRPGVGKAAVSNVLFLYVAELNGEPTLQFRYNTLPLEELQIDLLPPDKRQRSLSQAIIRFSAITERDHPRSIVCLIDESAGDGLDGFYVALLQRINRSGNHCGIAVLD